MKFITFGVVAVLSLAFISERALAQESEKPHCEQVRTELEKDAALILKSPLASYATFLKGQLQVRLENLKPLIAKSLQAEFQELQRQIDKDPDFKLPEELKTKAGQFMKQIAKANSIVMCPAGADTEWADGKDITGFYKGAYNCIVKADEKSTDVEPLFEQRVTVVVPWDFTGVQYENTTLELQSRTAFQWVTQSAELSKYSASRLFVGVGLSPETLGLGEVTVTITFIGPSKQRMLGLHVNLADLSKDEGKKTFQADYVKTGMEFQGCESF